MKLLSHNVTDFRNIVSLSLEFDDRVAVIVGNNAQGKTNLLESVWMLTGAHSFRTNNDRALVRTGEQLAVIDSVFISSDREQTARLTIGDTGRMMSRNKAAPKKASMFAGEFDCVVFSPDMLDIVKGSAEKRRRFVDTAMCQMYPSYLANLKTYNRLTAQKNSLLKDCRSVSAAYDMLDAFDESIASTAAELTRQRTVFFRSVMPRAAEYYERLSDGAEKLGFSYESSMFDGEISREAALHSLLSRRADDIRFGFCTVGPHRDELVLTLDNEDTRQYSSQGQKRSIVLALKLAETDEFTFVKGERPILLLDDVLSELDADRQSFMIDCIGGCQSIITGCDPHAIERKTDCRIYKIHGGELIE